ncbi:HD domain-containing protein [Candidatus Bipolaricaulota bacterium]|nr:HD domain-containing protein [Candidatus Bipolaricaulota bacterium]
MGFVHLYGVSATAVLLAHLRGLDKEIAGVAKILHDLATYRSEDSDNHGPRSATLAFEILGNLGTFTKAEISIIHSAISQHSNKAEFSGRYDELLKDADVLQHDLYNPSHNPYHGHGERRTRLRDTLEKHLQISD